MNVYELGRIDITKAGNNCKVMAADIDGDGVMEIICAQPDGGIDDRYVPHQVTCVTAYKLNGEMLWQKGEVSDNPGGPGSDYPIQIADIDDDGNNEVLVVNDKKLLFLAGKTGEVKREIELPDDEAHDCIVVCNLSGKKTPTEIILKNRYFDMWAIDNTGKVLWKHHGNIGHFPLACDINEDGYDEIMAGYDLLDHNGKLLWSCKDLDDHADCLWMGDVNADGKQELCVGGSVTCLYSRDGEELWRYTGSIESQHVALGHFIPGSKDLQIAGLDRIQRGDGHKGQWDGKDGMFLLDSKGNEIWKEDRKTKGWLTIVNTFMNWNGEGRDYILAYRRGGGVNPTLYNEKMEEVVVFPEDGYVVMADLLGRNMTDAIVYHDNIVCLYSGTNADITVMYKDRYAIKQSGNMYRQTLYPGAIYK